MSARELELNSDTHALVHRMRTACDAVEPEAFYQDLELTLSLVLDSLVVDGYGQQGASEPADFAARALACVIGHLQSFREGTQ